MNCEALRERLAVDPSGVDEEFDAHARTCSACEAFRTRLLKAEQLIGSALRFDVEAFGQDSPVAPGVPAGRRRWAMPALGFAAALVAGILAWALVGGGLDLGTEALAAEVTAHWYNEPESWTEGGDPVSADLLASVLGGAAQIDPARLRAISFAKTCWVAGEWIPHLTIQGEQGPYMVLLMPGRILENSVPLELRDEGLSGHILPAGNGSIAVLGGGPDMEEIEATVVSAVEWQI